MNKLSIPRFENEAQEADWWYEKRHEVAAETIEAVKAGKNGEGTRGRYRRRVLGIEDESSNSIPSASVDHVLETSKRQ
jgi:hypothetical protein